MITLWNLATATEALAPDFILDTPPVLQVPTDTVDWLAVDRRSGR